MRVFRRKNKPNGFDRASGREPLPDIVYQMGAEAAARYVAQNQRAGGNFAPSAGIYNMPAIYPAVPVPYADEEYYEEEVGGEEVERRGRASSPLNLVRSVLRSNRSKSRDPYNNRRARDRYQRANTPDPFGERVLGSPLHFHARASSPEHFGRAAVGSPLHMQARAGSPYLIPHADPIASPVPFMQPMEESLVNSSVPYGAVVRTAPPDVARRLQRAQLSQDLQRVERQQRLQASLAQANPVAYQSAYASYPQQFYPAANPNARMHGWPMAAPPVYSFY